MAKELASNVHVDGRWFGPAYPDNEVTPEIAKLIPNPAAWDNADEPFALGFTEDDALRAAGVSDRPAASKASAPKR